VKFIYSTWNKANGLQGNELVASAEATAPPWGRNHLFHVEQARPTALLNHP
jgi:hypothetical protein